MSCWGTLCSLRKPGEASSAKSSVVLTEAALVAAGPCNGFESLRTLQSVEKDAEMLTALADRSEQESWNSWLKECTDHWEELLASCRVALTELKRNSKVKANPKSKANASPKKAKGKGAGKGKTQDDVYAIFKCADRQDHGGCQYLRKLVETEEFTSDRLGTPLLGDVDSTIMENLEYNAALQNFMEEFRKSDTRFLSGRALLPLAEVAENLSLRTVPVNFVMVACDHTSVWCIGKTCCRTSLTQLLDKCSSVKFASDVAKLRHTFKHLPNLLNVDFWASMSGQGSVRFEAAGLPVIRYQFSGVRELVLLKAIDFTGLV